MQLDERIATLASTLAADNEPDAHHPVRKFAAIDAEMKFVEKALAGQPMSEQHVNIMAEECCVEPAVIVHTVKVKVYKGRNVLSRDTLKGDLKVSGKKVAVDLFVRQRLGLADVTKRLKSGREKTYPATVRKLHLIQALALLGIATGKKNREVTEAHVPKLIQMIFDTAHLSVSAGSLIPVTVHLPTAGAAQADAEEADVDPEVAAEAELSDDEDPSDDDDSDIEPGDTEEEVGEEEEVEEDERIGDNGDIDKGEEVAGEESDLASRLEAVVTVGAGVRRGCRLRKRKQHPGE